MTNIIAARALALAAPALLIAGAWYAQLVWGLFPCEMCHWQRWPHYAAILLAALAFFVRLQPLQMTLVALAGFAILTSGGIGAWHAGVEYGWWEGLTTCATAPSGSGNIMLDIMRAPLARCDEAPWQLFGISLAGYNFIASTLAGLGVFALLTRRPA